MERYRLFDIRGSGEQVFCSILQVAVEELAQKDFADKKESLPFRIDPFFVTRAYEKLKSVKLGDIDGQKLQEFLITAILKWYLEQAHPDAFFHLAFPNDDSVDTIIISSEKEDKFKSMGDNKYMPNKVVTIYPFQIKEVREQGDIMKNISASIAEAKGERFAETTLFKHFSEYFRAKVLKKDYSNTMLLLFLRAPSFVAFNTEELITAFRNLNSGYFRNIWFIAAVDKLINKDGREEVLPMKSGTTFHFYVKELIRSEIDFFAVVTLGCTFKAV